MQNLVAWWGAITGTLSLFLAAYLGYRELRKEKRQLQVTLVYFEFADAYTLRVVNTGHRPVSITQVGIRVYDKKIGKDPVNTSWISPTIDDELVPLPITLEDGDPPLFFGLPFSYTKLPLVGATHATGYVRDSEQKIYEATWPGRAYNEKFDLYSDISDTHG